MLDEVPCNIDSRHQNPFVGKPSGDWKGLKTNGINFMMSLKPLEEGNNRGIFTNLLDTFLSREKALKLHFPEDLAHIELNRVYRCTNNISEFYQEIIKCLNQSRFNFVPKINASSKSYDPGHDIHGENPEILFLKKCTCIFYCKTPVEHLLIPNQTNIIALLKRVELKLKMKITVLIDTSVASQKCVNWLVTELQNGNLSDKFVVKTIAQCRGLEFPALVTISNEGYRIPTPLWKSSLLDAWTRVTSALFIIHMERQNFVFTDMLKHAIENQVAPKAIEQDN